MTMTEMQNFLTTLMRSIDKKTALSVEIRRQTDRPAVTVRLTRDRRNGILEIAEADLEAGQTDLAQRHRIRTALKRTHDRMWETGGYLFSTKIERHAPEGTSFSRPAFPRGRR